jgi:hypothetical protein
VESDDEDRTFSDRLRRFFWLPRETPRGPAPIWPLIRVWLFCIAVGAGASALGWGDGLGLMVLGTVFAMLDDVVKAVRCRWPAFAVGLLAGWSAEKLASAGLSAPTAPVWADFPSLAFGSLAALATFAAITRLSGRE